jgi:chemotaxis protein methyltransferase CheR
MALVANARAPGASEHRLLGEREFRRIRALLRERTGIELGDAKRMLCQSRLLRRLRVLGLRGYREYLELLDDPDSNEHVELVNALTTNVTAFFREMHHFDLLASQVLPPLVAAGRRIRMWSAGCSTGEEPWSLAMTLHEAIGRRPDLDARILATDIDTQVLATASTGIYTDEQVEPVSPVRRRRYLLRGKGEKLGLWRVGEPLRPLVKFHQLNLFAPWPMRGSFDVIACRNVMIYFDAENKAHLLREFRNRLVPGGYLLLGHSESIPGGAEGFASCGRTAYRKL